MKGILTLVQREVASYFVSPIAYSIMVIFLLLMGFGFGKNLAIYSHIPANIIEMAEMNLRNFMVAKIIFWAQISMILCLPALSMRLFSEEKKGGTAELLLTSPITTTQLALGKYLGSVFVLAVMILLTLPFPLVLEWKAEPEWAVIGTAYLGMLLFGMVILAVGVFASSLTENQIVALLLTYALYLPLWLIDSLVGFMGGALDDILDGLAVGKGVRGLGQGLIDTHYFVLPVFLVFVFLFLCVQVLDSNRWR